LQNSGLVKYNFTYNPANNELLKSSSHLYNTWLSCGSYSYDKNGNLLSENITNCAISPNGQWNYRWDVSGHLLKVSNYTSVQGLYAYDGLERRVESIESSTTFYAYLGTNTLSELVSGGATTDYVSADGLMIAKVTGTTVTYYHTDALGSTRLTTNSAGNVVFSDDYQPYGSDSNSKGSETYRFTGKPVSQSTGLYYDSSDGTTLPLAVSSAETQ
jgi:hypothetical protein